MRPIKILITDTDETARRKLSELVAGLSPGAEIITLAGADGFQTSVAGTVWDIAFLETEIGEHSGIALALEIKKHSPRCNFIFVTSFPQHSLEAYRARPSGFVLKPFTEDDIRHELDDLRYPVDGAQEVQRSLRVVTFGSFAVYAGDAPLKFSRTLSKEIFAYLIDQCGYPVTSRDIAADVLGETSFDPNISKRVSKAVGYLLSDLQGAGAGNVIDKQNRQIRVNRHRLSCDLYDALDGNADALAGYDGNYMIEYSWSETSFAMGLLREKTGSQELF